MVGLCKKITDSGQGQNLSGFVWKCNRGVFFWLVDYGISEGNCVDALWRRGYCCLLTICPAAVRKSVTSVHIVRHVKLRESVLRHLPAGSDSIMSSDTAVKSCIQRLTMTYIIETKEILW